MPYRHEFRAEAAALCKTSFGKCASSAGRLTFGGGLCLLLMAKSHTVAGQTLSESLKTDPTANYFIIKRLTKSATNPGTIEHWSADQDWYLGTCHDGPDFGDGSLGGALNLANQLGRLATTVVTVKADLRGLKYPEATWRPMLLAFEDNELKFLKLDPKGDISEHENKFEVALAATLQQYRSHFAPTLPRIIGDDSGCGAGEIGVNINSDPPHARIQLITTFTYLLCEAKSLEPEKANTKCDGWYDATNKPRVSGGFKYKATWPDGVSHIDNLNADSLNDGDTLTLHKPPQVK